MLMIMQNKRVNFSMNPIYKLSIFTNQAQKDSAMELLKQSLKPSTSSSDVIYMLQHLNLSDTFLGIDPNNYSAFFQMLSILGSDRTNLIKEIDLSQNHLKTLDCNTLDFEAQVVCATYDATRLFMPSQHPFRLICSSSSTGELNLILSHNQLKCSDMLSLISQL